MREIATRNRIRAVLVYPVIVLLTAVALIAFLVTYIVPTFAELFKGLDEELPIVTRILIDGSEFVRSHWFAILLIVVLTALLLRSAFLMRRVRYLGNLLKLRSAVFGPLTKEYVVVQTCRTLGMLLQSGIHLLKALELTRDASPNLVVSDALDQVRDEVTRGRGLERPLREMRVFPPLVVDMIVTAQETGALAENLVHAATIYEEEFENKMRFLSSMIEPAMVIVIGVVVIFVALTLFLPYIRLLSLMGGGSVAE